VIYAGVLGTLAARATDDDSQPPSAATAGGGGSEASSPPERRRRQLAEAIRATDPATTEAIADGTIPTIEHRCPCRRNCYDRGPTSRTRGRTPMPAVPHLPSDDPGQERVPDVDEIVERILNGGNDPSPSPAGA
jgi:hypothetical protein